MKLANWLSRSAATHPERVALAGGGERLTYAELEVRVADAARRLAGRGVGSGDRVALAMDASIDYVVLIHALVKLGAVAVPLDPRLAPAELANRLGDVDARRGGS